MELVRQRETKKTRNILKVKLKLVWVSNTYWTQEDVYLQWDLKKLAENKFVSTVICVHLSPSKSSFDRESANWSVRIANKNKEDVSG